MSDFDPADFVDTDFQAHKTPHPAAATVAGPRAPSREEVDSKVVEAQLKLAELKRAQEELERERSALEETRRRQMELQTGRQELIQNITRGVGLLGEAEFNSRRDAEQMAKALAALRDALGKIESIHEETWSRDTFSVELTRALTALENARMEWNSARLKFPVLAGETPQPNPAAQPGAPAPAVFDNRSFAQLCKLGLAFTWPIVLALLASVAVVLALFVRR